MRNSVLRKQIILSIFSISFFREILGDDHRSNCSKVGSQFVRKFVKNHLKSELTTFGEKSFPETCPFDLRSEVYQNYEMRKVEETASKWTCNFCGKSFVSEEFLENHFDLKHPGHLRNDLKCLSDLCPYFRCDVHMDYYDRVIQWEESNCPRIHLNKRKQECYKMITKCVPPSLQEADARYLWVYAHYSTYVEGMENKSRRYSFSRGDQSGYYARYYPGLKC
ncbi:DgyrCDS10607 [Dimorphilus gyrociliatus]|uniref:DgyrCDS10607 n=1 Tax=Dimorphilus gyrociliatus TaxID=2664684 RepID=A0A7I8W1U0_9ANNE|nr:DgyrCDS10607 [Dimorphilus gyrociliatus]